MINEKMICLWSLSEVIDTNLSPETELDVELTH